MTCESSRRPLTSCQPPMIKSLASGLSITSTGRFPTRIGVFSDTPRRKSIGPIFGCRFSFEPTKWGQVVSREISIELERFDRMLAHGGHHPPCVRARAAAESEINFAIGRVVVIAKPGWKVVGVLGELPTLTTRVAVGVKISAVRTGNDEGGIVRIEVQVPFPEASGENPSGPHPAPRSPFHRRDVSAFPCTIRCCNCPSPRGAAAVDRVLIVVPGSAPPMKLPLLASAGTHTSTLPRWPKTPPSQMQNAYASHN